MNLLFQVSYVLEKKKKNSRPISPAGWGQGPQKQMEKCHEVAGSTLTQSRWSSVFMMGAEMINQFSDWSSDRKLVSSCFDTAHALDCKEMRWYSLYFSMRFGRALFYLTVIIKAIAQILGLLITTNISVCQLWRLDVFLLLVRQKNICLGFRKSSFLPFSDISQTISCWRTDWIYIIIAWWLS